MDWEAGAVGWPQGNSIVATGREASEEGIFAVLCKQMIFLYESFLFWMQKSFPGKAEAPVGILSGFL